MLTVFLCHASEDRETAAELAGFLERGTGARVFLDEGCTGPSDDLIAKVNEGRMADVVLALLSASSTPPRWPLREWQDAFWHLPEEENVAVATLLLGDCRFPDLLRRRNFFELAAGRLPVFRTIKRWITAPRVPAEPPFVPAVPPHPVPEADVERLAAMLADRPGMTVVPDPLVALAFAAHHAGEFEAVFWAFAEPGAAALVGSLAAQAGLPTGSPGEDTLRSLHRLCADHRFLVLLDATAEDRLGLYQDDGLTSVLAMDRTPAAAPPDLPPDAARMAAALTACGGWSSNALACAVAGFDQPRGEAALAELLARGLALRPDTRNAAWVSLCHADPGKLAARHASLAARGDDLAAARHAFYRADPEAGRRAVSLATGAGRLAEALEILQALRRAAEMHGDEDTHQYCVREECRILDRWERFEESAALRRAAGAYCGMQLGFEW